ncbi:cobalamin-dependent protein [Candidatus Pacearchaeota archaeon]|nr:cobalamin-dependent protein [Candidatus Pacearchaeota archaeon]
MRLLLITPPNTSKEVYGKLSSVGTLYPPLGLAYIAAYAEKQGHEVKVIDAGAENYDFEDINKIALKFCPDLVGMQTYCTTLNKVYKIAENLKNITDAKIVLGGPQATLEPSKAISNKYVDFVIYGEGEKTIIELLSALKKGNFSKVLGLVYKTKEKIKTNPPRPLIQNLDEIPLPARHLFPMEKYHSSANLRGKKTLNIMTSRGCPYRCAYCAGSLIFGKNHRFHSSERVIEEMKLLKEKYGADSIQFFDETFTVNRKRVIELCDKMIEAKLGLEWSCFTRVNLVDEELLKKMKQAGCYLIFYGLESGVQRLLDLIKKDITLEQSEKAMKMTHEAGIETWVSFMLNLPSATKKEEEQTIDFAIKVNPTFVQFPIATPYPGTELYDIALKHGKLKENWEDFTSWDEIVFTPHGKTEKEIKNIVKKAYRKFYLRPTYILKRIRSILKLPLNKSFALIKVGLLTFFT